jgi:oligopeptidase A
MSNPLLSDEDLIAYSQVKSTDIKPAIEKAIEDNKAAITTILEKNQIYTFDNFVRPLELIEERFSRLWRIINHLNAVNNETDWRRAYDEILIIVSQYYMEKRQHLGIYKGYLSIQNSKEYSQLSATQKKLIENKLRNFKLSGILLTQEEQKLFKEYNVHLSELRNKYEENILDATEGWTLLITDKEKLQGLPQRVLSSLEESATKHNQQGWLITLDYPCYDAIMTFAVSRDLRKAVYTAYVTLASDQGPNAGRWDNAAIMKEILKTRQQVSELLGFENFAEYSLATKMVKKPQEVLNFLNDMVNFSKRKAEVEFKELKKYALEELNISDVEAWDIRYCSDKFREKYYAFTGEMLRAYFPEEIVFQGLFLVAKKLYGVSIKEIKNVDRWHPCVKLFEVYDKENNLCGKFYTDLYARAHKHHGAWCNGYQYRYKNPEGKFNLPIAYLVANFTSACSGTEPQLSHQEVVTLFHEFGHCLHHIMTKIDYPSLSGGHGVAWDAIELPSQLMECWCWEKEALDLISQNKTTGETLPDELFLKLKKAKNFQIGLGIIRQLEFSLFDMELHSQPFTEEVSIQEILNKIRARISIYPTPSFNRFQNSFSHIFAGGYAAGYYSYLWSEVMSADTYELFKENGKIFDEKIGKRFLEFILEKGGSKEFEELYLEFRGRLPVVDAFLRSHELY